MNDLNVSWSAGYLAQPVAVVRELLVAELPRLASLLPNVEKIEPLSSHWGAGRLVRRDRWFGRSSSRLLRALVPAGLVAWTVRSTWQLEPFAIAWTLEPLTHPWAIEGAGTIHFHAETDRRTRVAVLGTLSFGQTNTGSLFALGRAPAVRLVEELLRSNLGALFQQADLLLARSVGAPAALA